MPWSPEQFAARHDKSLSKSEAKKASRQANAIAESGADEGVAIATAIKRVNRLRKRGLISDRAHKRMPERWGRADDVNAATA